MKQYLRASHQKTIATKKIKRWQKLDRLAFLVPPLLFLFLSLGKDGRLIWAILLREQDFVVTTAGLLLLAVAAVIISLPLILIWRAVSHTMKKAAISNATFQADEDFDYYREKLTGIPPATISLLMDLQIETKKDVAALLLKYVKMGAVSMENGTVHVLNQALPGLLASDRTLLALIAGGQVQPANLGAWKQQATAEAVASGNLKYKGAGQNFGSVSRSCVSGCLCGCFLPVLIFLAMGFMAVAINNSGWLEKLDGFFAAIPPSFGIGQLEYLLSSPDMVIAICLTALIMLSFLAILLLPLTSALRTVLSISGASIRLKRTEAGEILTAQISGLKNFIRDFSNLAQAEKEQLVLWDDFLIYAVVLEENERIIEDLFHMKNLKYRDFILF